MSCLKNSVIKLPIQKIAHFKVNKKVMGTKNVR